MLLVVACPFLTEKQTHHDTCASCLCIRRSVIFLSCGAYLRARKFSIGGARATQRRRNSERSTIEKQHASAAPLAPVTRTDVFRHARGSSRITAVPWAVVPAASRGGVAAPLARACGLIRRVGGRRARVPLRPHLAPLSSKGTAARAATCGRAASRCSTPAWPGACVGG